jgi:Flp pilus assembly protein TadD
MIHVVLLFLLLQAGAEAAPQHEKAGLAALKAGQSDTAISEFEKVTELNPGNAEGFYELGFAYMQYKDYASAVDPLRKAIQLDPGMVVAHQSLGYALLAQGYATEAVAQFQTADNDPAGLGIAQLQTGDLANAVRNLQIAVGARPNDPDLLYYLARASGLLSKQVYEMLLTSFPNSPRSNQAMAEAYSAMRQTQQAADHYQAALHARPDLPGAWLALGQVYASANLLKQAEDAFQADIKLEPGNAEAAYRLGSALLQDGDAHGARVQLERANQLQPDMPETLSALGKAESQDGNYAAAEKAWKRVIELEKTGELVSQAHFGLSGMYRKQGRVQEAAREMQEFQETRPGQTEK